MDRTDAGGVVAEGITGCGVAAGPRAAAQVGVLALAAAPGDRAARMSASSGSLR